MEGGKRNNGKKGGGTKKAEKREGIRKGLLLVPAEEA